MQKPNAPVIFLMGPTASGKTGLAVELAQHFPIELISVDSALVYQGMDIGTAKPDAATLKRAPHHLIDLILPTQSYSAAQFRDDSLRLIQDIHARNKIPFFIGGTMLYFNTLQHGMNALPEADAAIRKELVQRAEQLGWPTMHRELAKIDPITAQRLQPNDAQRIERALEIYTITGQPMSALLEQDNNNTFHYRLLKLALMPSDRGILHQRIAQRFDTMLEQGLAGEVTRLRTQYPQLTADTPSMRCVGYRQTWEHLDGKYDIATLREKGIIATRQLAKRQMTWLRGMDDTEIMDCLYSSLLDSTSNKLMRWIKA
ncbi:MAG TPA: tRNA (adenosine(37)-N6)-dimethylallyltransferase MiaA [Methylophilaceae bacterium]